MIKRAKEFFGNINKTPLQIGKERYESIKDDLRDQFQTISDLADVLYVIQYGIVRIRIIYRGDSQSDIKEISQDVNSVVERLKHTIDLPVGKPYRTIGEFNENNWFIDIGEIVGKRGLVHPKLPWKSIY